MQRRRRSLKFLFSLILVFGAAQAVAGAAPEARQDYAFLAEMATIQRIPGHSPALFRPESEPSRIEIAYFLFRLDQRLARVAGSHDLDLRNTLRYVWSAANPDAAQARADVWADEASVEYRRLLIEYHPEMSALGYQLRPDTYPLWCRGNTDVLGN